MAYKYCTATNWGKNFFTHEERKQFHLSGHAGDVWVVGDNLYGDQWIGKVSGATGGQSGGASSALGVGGQIAPGARTGLTEEWVAADIQVKTLTTS